MARSVWAQYKITDHVCRICFGRVLVCETGARCADCGAVGKTVSDVCACGTMLNAGQNAGLRCIKNPAVSVECPAEIVVIYVGIEVKPAAKAPGLKMGGGGLFDEA